MDLKIATPNDLFECVFMMKNFIESSEYAHLFDLEHATAFARQHLSNPNGTTIVLSDGKRLKGMLAGVVTQHPFVPIRVASDLCWWVEPDARGSRKGLELIKAFEYWAKDIQKVNMITMASMNDPRVDNIYNRFGYRKTEHAWTKII